MIPATAKSPLRPTVTLPEASGASPSPDPLPPQADPGLRDVLSAARADLSQLVSAGRAIVSLRARTLVLNAALLFLIASVAVVIVGVSVFMVLQGAAAALGSLLGSTNAGHLLIGGMGLVTVFGGLMFIKHRVLRPAAPAPPSPSRPSAQEARLRTHFREASGVLRRRLALAGSTLRQQLSLRNLIRKYPLISVVASFIVGLFTGRHLDKRAAERRDDALSPSGTSDGRFLKSSSLSSRAIWFKRLLGLVISVLVRRAQHAQVPDTPAGSSGAVRSVEADP